MKRLRPTAQSLALNPLILTCSLLCPQALQNMAGDRCPSDPTIWYMANGSLTKTSHFRQTGEASPCPPLLSVPYPTPNQNSCFPISTTII